MTSAFIGYRRSDLQHFALWLADRLAYEFGVRSVFIDRSSLPPARNWSVSIEDALNASSVLMLLVGPSWLKTSNEWGQRRIDDDKDVVRLEIATALRTGKRILPIFLGHGSAPPLKALPEAIRPAFENQGIILEDAELPSGVQRVVSALMELGFRKVQAPQELPDPRKCDVKPLQPCDIHKALQNLPGWSIVTLTGTGLRAEGEALYRRYLFHGFQPAMRFMMACAPIIQEKQHHPRWQNTWRTVDVWLTTFDIGCSISSHDVILARCIQEVFALGEWRHARGTP